MIHIVVGYKRPQYKEKMIEHFRGHNITLHPVSYFYEDFNEAWVKPLVVNETPGWTQCYDKFNQWLDKEEMIDEDQYVFISDDDAFEDIFGSFPNTDVVIISAKRGVNIPDTGQPYPPTPLTADPSNMTPGSIDLMQMIFKGKIIKDLRWANSELGDGMMAEKLKDYNVTYAPQLFGLFNYFQPGRY